MIRAEIGSEIEIRQPVVVDVADSDACTIVVVEVVQNVERLVFGQAILECDAGRTRREQLEQWWRGRLLVSTSAGGDSDRYDNQGHSPRPQEGR